MGHAARPRSMPRSGRHYAESPRLRPPIDSKIAPDRNRIKTGEDRMRSFGIAACAAAVFALGALAAVVATPAGAQVVKIGVIDTFSGPQASFGDYTDKGFRLYIKLHQKDLPPGVSIELINRDDGGPNPDRARQLAQELVTRDQVNLLAGAAFTPIGIAVASVADEAKIPFVVTNAASAVVTAKSQYAVRFSFTVHQSNVSPGSWGAKHYKTANTWVTAHN